MRSIPPKLYSYAEITASAADQIAAYMHSSRSTTGIESRRRKEIAYGIYMGWRSLVESYPDQTTYRSDDARLETLLRD